MFERDESLQGHPVRNALKTGCEWVTKGEGMATTKFDGTNVKIRDGVLFKRQKPKERDYDSAAYVSTSRDDPTDQYLYEAFDRATDTQGPLPDGIYEAYGPKIQGNPEKVDGHALVRVVPADPFLHLCEIPRDFEGLKEYLSAKQMEGIVFHHPDGRMANIKKRDFRLR
jgi:hypothetical protein